MGVYTPTTWTTTTGINITRLNNLETQYVDASMSLPPGLFTAFVQSGLAATKDGTTVNQLDVTSGVAWLLQTDGTLQHLAPSASTTGQFTTATPSTTYYLDLNPDGTWSWGTAHSAQSNYLSIAQVTTDASGNISTVTDERTLNTTLLSGGGLAFSGYLTIGSGGGCLIQSPQTGGASGLYFKTWTGSAAVTPFSVGGQFNSALAWVDNSGDFYFGGAGARIDWDSSNLLNAYWTPQSGSQNGHVFITWTGTAQKNTFGVGLAGGAPAYVDYSGNYNGPAGGGIPTTRNGTATSVPIYTGTTTPSTPPTGSIWVKA